MTGHVVSEALHNHTRQVLKEVTEVVRSPLKLQIPGLSVFPGRNVVWKWGYYISGNDKRQTVVMSRPFSVIAFISKRKHGKEF